MDKINILNSIARVKSGGFSIDKNIDKDVIAAVIKNKQPIAYVINGGDETTISINRPNITLCPYINLNKDRTVTVITGNSGSGKTLMASILTSEYHKHYRNDKVYFISGNNLEDDESMNQLTFIKQIDVEQVSDLRAEDVTESLVIIDDCDYNKNNKSIMSFLNDIVERGRKFSISVIFISHINSRMQASVVYRDFDLYITFNDNLINNRLLDYVLKINLRTLQSIVNMNPSFIAFNKQYKTIVTNNYVGKY